MQEWQKVLFQRPGTPGAAYDKAEEVLGEATGNLAVARAGIASTPTIDFGGASAPADGVSCSDLAALTHANFSVVVVHPWSEGIGQGVGHYRYLSPTNALVAAANKLVDTPDDLRPEDKKHDALALVLAGESYAKLAITLDEFWRIYSEPALHMCARRCAQLAALEGTKTILPNAAANARWRNFGEAFSYNFNGYTKVAGHPLSVVEGYDCDGESLEDNVVALTLKKQLMVNVGLEVAKGVLNSINGGSGVSFFVKDERPNTIRRILLDSTLDIEMPLSICLIFIGEVGSLDELKGHFTA